RARAGRSPKRAGPRPVGGGDLGPRTARRRVHREDPLLGVLHIRGGGERADTRRHRLHLGALRAPVLPPGDEQRADVRRPLLPPGAADPPAGGGRDALTSSLATVGPVRRRYQLLLVPATDGRHDQRSVGKISGGRAVGDLADGSLVVATVRR